MNNSNESNSEQGEQSKSGSSKNASVPTLSEMEVILAIVNRPRLESWDSTARKLGISRRTLFEYRQNPRVQAAVQTIVINHLRIDAADILNELVRKAKRGNLSAAKLFLEQTNIVADFEREQYRQHQIGLSAFIDAFREEFAKFPKVQRLQFVVSMRKKEINFPKELFDVLTQASKPDDQEENKPLKVDPPNAKHDEDQ